jgi:tetratricopeptide (TPR) repeat protein
MTAPTVFISYSHDSNEHAARVRGLHASLCRDGCECRLDVYKNTDEDWPLWMTGQLIDSNFVLCVVTETYARRFNDKELPDKGLGVGWEAGLIRRLLYQKKLHNDRVFPVLFERADQQHIPLELQGYDYFMLDGGAGYETLLRKVLNRPLYVEPRVGTQPELETDAARPLFDRPTADVTSAAPHSVRVDISRIDKYAPAELIGREAELKILSDAWQQAVNGEKKRPYILTFVALGGEGKTSLVAKWAADLAYQGWPGCDPAFAWSFYSQGTSEKTQASSDSFLKEGLLFFGDVEMANSAASSFDKGRRLARLVGERRALLILDGVEPLQYAPTSPTGSELKDQGVAALLKALASNNHGLCVVTTRYSIPDLRNFWQTTAPEIKLKSLSIEASVALLRRLGVKGTRNEFEQLVHDVKGHALTLNLLGSYLRDAHAGDIRKRDLVKLEEADAEEQAGHAFHVMDAYVKSLKDEGEKGTRALSVLRLLGLFDRPATADCLNALWSGEEIGGLTGPLIGVGEAQRNITLRRLEDANLITVNRQKGSETLVSLDAHPLLREYFATRVRAELRGAWRAAHRRVYEHLRDNTHEGGEPTLEDLQPLYQAVVHGCQAGLQEETFDEVYLSRIARRNEFYSARKLGAFGAELGAVTSFFEVPFKRVDRRLGKHWIHAGLFNQAASYLRALGRLNEALAPMRVAGQMDVETETWDGAAASYSNLSELELTLGELDLALGDVEKSVTYADRSGDAFSRKARRARVADTLHQAGRRSEAEKLFQEAEEIHAQSQAAGPQLYSLSGFQYCDFLLAVPERAAWQRTLECGDLSALSGGDLLAAGRPPNAAEDSGDESPYSTTLHAVSRRATIALKIVLNGSRALLDIALNHLTLGRAALYAFVFDRTSLGNQQSAIQNVTPAVEGLRRAGTQHRFPPGLLTRAWLRFLIGTRTGPESAQEDLDEAWEIAERGPMRLFMADIHLYRARLFHAVKPYPWNKFADGREGRGAKEDLADARKLIEKCGYWRRKEELEDAEEAAKNW